jgi:hypothetical protein
MLRGESADAGVIEYRIREDGRYKAIPTEGALAVTRPYVKVEHAQQMRAYRERLLEETRLVPQLEPKSEPAEALLVLSDHGGPAEPSILASELGWSRRKAAGAIWYLRALGILPADYWRIRGT